MQVSSINNVSTSNKVNFNGVVDKSVIRYLDNTCLHSNNTKEARVFADKILEKLTQFMKTLHKDTIISVKEEMVTRRFGVSTPTNIDVGLKAQPITTFLLYFSASTYSFFSYGIQNII